MKKMNAIFPMVALLAGSLSGCSADTINGHEYVDLGLSVKWAACNVGADKPWEYGGYYAWGETETKSSYTKENNKTYGRSIGDIAGDPYYDVARAKWGAPWQLPTEDEIYELMNKCQWTWTTQNGHDGLLVTGPNGNSIFLPAAGYYAGTTLSCVGQRGLYWSSSPDGTFPTDAYNLDFSSSGFGLGNYTRYYGQSVRPVSE